MHPARITALLTLLLAAPLGACGDDGGGAGGAGGQGGATSSASSTGGAGGTTSSSSAGGAGGQGGEGAGGPYASCAEAGATDCFSNYDCPDASTRCENVGTAAEQVPCCVPGPRGDGEVGDPCTSEHDCKSSLCVELDGGVSLCTDTCADENGCVAELPQCIPVAFSGSDLTFCLP